MDEAQFEEIARQYRDNLFAIAFQYTKNAADADDMAQIALIKCYEAKKPFESEQHIRRWLIRVTVNECKRYLVSPGGGIPRRSRTMRKRSALRPPSSPRCFSR